KRDEHDGNQNALHFMLLNSRDQTWSRSAANRRSIAVHREQVCSRLMERNLQLFDPNIPPTNFERLFALPDLMHLQGDEALGGQVVFQFDGRNAVDPGLDRVALAFDAELIPVVRLERLAG